MGPEVTEDGWAFADRSKTTAEVIRGLYLDIRQAAGQDTLIIGCNTMGHLAAGIFEMQRIGDDTSGREWNRTRDMGVNCLAFRAPQNGTFFAVDADCAGQVSGNSVPWEKNSEWLNLLAHSGTPLFVSFPHETVSPTQEIALRAALATASQYQPLAEPLDWMTQRTPEKWLFGRTETDFSWK
jgi:alpha-galactosidase